MPSTPDANLGPGESVIGTQRGMLNPKNIGPQTVIQREDGSQRIAPVPTIQKEVAHDIPKSDTHYEVVTRPDGTRVEKTVISGMTSFRELPPEKPKE